MLLVFLHCSAGKLSKGTVFDHQEIDKFLFKQKGKDAHTAVKTTATDRVRSYESRVLHVKTMAFCFAPHAMSFWTILDRKSSIDKYFESKTHKTKSSISMGSKQKTLKTTLNCKTGAQVIYYKSPYCCLPQT